VALTNNILVQTPPNPDINFTAYTGPGVQARKFSVTAADLAALGAFTTGDIVLENLPPKTNVLRVFTKHSAAVVGVSVSACTAQVKTANNATLGGSALDVFQAVADSASVNTYVAALKESWAAATPLLLHIVATGANLSVVTAGQIDVQVTYEVLS
jgi:hypothetical protein